MKFQKAKSKAGTKEARPQCRPGHIEGRLERSGNRYAHPSAGPTVRKVGKHTLALPRTCREPQCTRGPGRVDAIAARADAATNALESPAEHAEGCSTDTLRRHPRHKLPRGFPGLTHDRLRIGGLYRWCQQDRQAILTVSACQFSRRDECVVCSEPTKKGGGMRRQASVAARLKRFVPFAA